MSDGHTLPLPDLAPAPKPEERAAGEEEMEERLRAALGAEYELKNQIGRGGMGIVYRATDLRLKREVAIKVLPPDFAHRADLRKRFVREAQLAASLTHPHIVPIYDAGQRNGVAWIVMALINGESARDLIRRHGPQPAHVVARVMRETAWALSYAHARGVVHRDIKPDNILIERASGRALVTDFGLAKITSAEGTPEHESLTQPGGVLGTPSFMPPEQARGKDSVDHRADIYSLGMVGHYMLAGRNPFEATNPQAIMARVLTEAPPDIANIRPDAPVWLSDVIRKATARKPAQRFDHAEAMADALDRGETPKEPPTSVSYFLDWVEAYVQFSILFSWGLFIIGVPKLPSGSGLILACLLALPMLLAVQLVNAEGIRWSDIRDGIVTRRAHWLRSASLMREAGINLPSVFVVALTFAGLVTIRWWGTIQSYVAIYMRSGGGEWAEWIEIDPGPAGRGEFLLSGPRWAFWYAMFGSILWARLFGLPIFLRRISPQQLDAIASWKIPRWLDLLGALLFKRITSSGRVIVAAADFRMLSEPAIQASLAFTRTRRSLRRRDRWRLRAAIRLGDMLVRRLWRTHERLRTIRAKARHASGAAPAGRAEAAQWRENLLAEGASALSGLRHWLEESASGQGEDDGANEPLMEELRRLTAPLRAIRLVNFAFAALWTGLFALNVADVFWLKLRLPNPEINFALFFGLLPAFGLFHMIKARFLY